MLNDKTAINTFYNKNSEKLFLQLWLKFWTRLFVLDYKTAKPTFRRLYVP